MQKRNTTIWWIGHTFLDLNDTQNEIDANKKYLRPTTS